MTPDLVFVRFYPKAGQEDRVETILRGMVGNTRTEPGCQVYHLYQTTAAAGGKVFCLIEKYADEAALQAHRDAQYYKDYRATIMDLLAQPIDITLMNALDVKER